MKTYKIEGLVHERFNFKLFKSGLSSANSQHSDLEVLAGPGEQRGKTGAESRREHGTSRTIAHLPRAANQSAE